MTDIHNRVEDLQIIFLQEGIQFTNPKTWEAMVEHVDVHKYFLGRDLSIEVTWDEALFSWYENVLMPLKRVVASWGVKKAFPKQTLGDIYLAVSDHWYFLKEENPAVGVDEAAISFIQHYGEGLSRWFSRFLLPA